MEERYFLVLFHEATPSTTAQPTGLILIPSATRTSQLPSELGIARLSQELADTKEYLRAIIEEQEATNQDLRAASEEVLSSNEEFQALLD